MIAKLVRYFVRFLIWIIPWLSADYRRRIKPTCKCPACGAVKRHRIQFDPVEKIVVLTCVVCSASWGYPPVVNPQKIVKPPREDET